MILLFIGAF
jgi:pre-rRNA-processing protein TSR1